GRARLQVLGCFTLHAHASAALRTDARASARARRRSEPQRIADASAGRCRRPRARGFVIDEVSRSFIVSLCYGAPTLTTAPATAPGGFKLRKPYLLFLGDAPDEAEAKTACGLRDWARDACKAQLRLPEAKLDLGLPDMTPDEAARAGVGSLVIGVAP